MSYQILGEEPSHASAIELDDLGRLRDGTQKLLMSTTSPVLRDESTTDIFENNVQSGKKTRLFPLTWIQHQHARESWRFVVANGALAGGVVLLINVIFLIVIHARFEVHDYAAVIYQGSCSTSSTTVIALHLLINVLSMVLLSCSNYSMQCLSSPSRSEIDAAHAQRRWLSVGVQNVRNLFFVARSKAFLWILLALSSVPLHLLWNSAVFQTLTANNYVAVSVTEDFLNGTSWSPFNNSDIDKSVGKLQHAAQANQLVRLDPADCIRAYAQNLQHSRKDVLLVSVPSDPLQLNTTSQSAFAAYYSPFSLQGGTTFSWMCDASTSLVGGGGTWACNIKNLNSFAASSADHWIPEGQTNYYGGAFGNQHNLSVAYCLSEVVPEQCTVNVVPLFLAIVITCNVVKVSAFLATLYISRQKTPLVTTGDAIQSFLEAPDVVTTDRCLVSKEDFETTFRRSRKWTPRAHEIGDVWTGSRERWGKAARWYTWGSFSFPAAVAVIVAGLFYGPDGFGDGTTETWPLLISLGIGQPQPNFGLTFDPSANLITTILMANTPQLIVTYIYLFYNNLMTTMLAMAEWCAFGSAPAKGLRVSEPKKNTAQRSTYFLQVPYRYGVPSVVTIASLHWLVSQMVFMAKIDVYDLDGNLVPRDHAFLSTGSIASVFFSPLAMLIAVSLAAALLIVLFAFAILARYPGHMPLSAGCSASLAAACQPDRGHVFAEDLSLKPIMWGVAEASDRTSSVGHATFSDEPVGTLVKGQLYA